MAIDVDGFAVFRAIAQAPERFRAIETEIHKAARGLLVKQLKAKGLDLQHMRDVHDAVGAGAFGLVLDGMTDAEIRSLVTKIDKHLPDLKSAAGDALRRRALELTGGAEPARKTLKAAAPKRPPAPRGTARVASVTSPAFSAVWDGKDHDAPGPKGRKTRS